MNNKRKLALAIVDYLHECTLDGTVAKEKQQAIEIAKENIYTAFNLKSDPNKDLAIAPTTLAQIFNIFLKTQAKTEKSKIVSEEEQNRAEEFKSLGNKKVIEKEYHEAINYYDRAIEIDAFNPVYFANRAAAKSQIGKHQDAIVDSLKAVEIDPYYSKGYSRLGHAYFSTSNYEAAVSAYEKAVDLEPSNNNFKSALTSSKSKLGQSDPGVTAENSAINANELKNLTEPADYFTAPGAATASAAPAGASNSVPALTAEQYAAQQQAYNQYYAQLYAQQGYNPQAYPQAYNPQQYGQAAQPAIDSEQYNKIAEELMQNPEIQKVTSNPEYKNLAEELEKKFKDCTDKGEDPLAALISDPKIAQLTQQLTDLFSAAQDTIAPTTSNAAN